MSEFKRGKNRVQKPVGIREMYKFYKQNSSNPVDYKQYARIIHLCNKKIVKAVVEEARVFEMPYRLGKIQIVKYERGFNKSKNKWAIDFKKTKELGFPVYHDSEYIYKFSWIKTRAKFINKTGYKFEANRAAKRKIAPMVKNKKVDYFKR